MEYDEDVCITAGELRKQNYKIPETIPDCAWILKWSIRDIPDSVKVEKVGDRTFKFSYSVEFTEPFRWLNGTFELG